MLSIIESLEVIKGGGGELSLLESSIPFGIEELVKLVGMREYSISRPYVGVVVIKAGGLDGK